MNSLKKSDFVQNILDHKGKVVVDADLYKLCENIERLTKRINQIVSENKKLQNDIVIVKNVNHNLENKSLSWKKAGERGAI